MSFSLLKAIIIKEIGFQGNKDSKKNQKLNGC